MEGVTVKQLLKNLLLSLSHNSRFQRLLERNVNFSQTLMGIGAGSFPDSSGEEVLVLKLEERYATTKQPLCIFDVGANKGQFLSLIVQVCRAHLFVFTHLSQVSTPIRFCLRMQGDIRTSSSIVPD